MRTRLVTPEQYAFGYLVKIGEMVDRRRYDYLGMDGKNYIVVDPEDATKEERDALVRDGVIER